MDFCSKKVIITCSKDKAHPRDICRKRQQLTFLAPAILCYYRTQIFSLASRFWVIRRKCIQPSATNDGGGSTCNICSPHCIKTNVGCIGVLPEAAQPSIFHGLTFVNAQFHSKAVGDTTHPRAIAMGSPGLAVERADPDS